MTALVRRVRHAIASRRRARELSSDLRAGAHSRREIQRLRRDWLRRAWRPVAVVMTLAGVAALASYLFLPQAIAPYAVGAVLATGVWVNYVFMLQTGGVMSHVVGVMGEEWTAAELAKLRRRGWHLVNHVMLEHVDIDHVVLGQGGFLSVETKFRSSWSSRSAADLGAWAERARRSARDLRFRLKTDHSVRPFVAMWGPGVAETYPEPFELEGVTFCPGRSLLDLVSSLPEVIPTSDVELAFTRLDEYVRRRDQGEQKVAGAPARRFGDYYNDFMLAALASTVATWLILLAVRLPAGSVWFVVLSALVVVGSLLVRRRTTPGPRLRAVTTALAGTGAALLLALVAVLVVYAIRS